MSEVFQVTARKGKLMLTISGKFLAPGEYAINISVPIFRINVLMIIKEKALLGFRLTKQVRHSREYDGQNVGVVSAIVIGGGSFISEISD